MFAGASKVNWQNLLWYDNFNIIELLIYNVIASASSADFGSFNPDDGHFIL